MAQYFYDLSILDRGGLPAMMPLRSTNITSSETKAGTVMGYFGQLGFSQGGTDVEFALWAGLDVTNVEALYRATISYYYYGANYGNAGGPSVFLRGRSNAGVLGNRAYNGYYFALNGHSILSDHMKVPRVYTYENGTYGSLDIGGATWVTTHTVPFKDWFYARVRAEGTTLRMKVWKDGELEPGTWSLDVTNSIFTQSGDVVLNFGRGAAYIVDFLSIGTDGDPAPMSYPGGNRIVAGTLLTPDSEPADGYVVRCYHRDTGALLGETLSNEIGAFTFSLPIPQTEKVYCVGVDQLGNQWGAPIKDLISPVTP